MKAVQAVQRWSKAATPLSPASSLPPPPACSESSRSPTPTPSPPTPSTAPLWLAWRGQSQTPTQADSSDSPPQSDNPATDSDTPARLTKYTLHHYLHPKLVAITYTPSVTSSAMSSAEQPPLNPQPPDRPSPAPDSAHDAIVARFLRPAPQRSLTSPSPLKLPSISRTLSDDATPTPTDDERPIAAILDGPLDPGGGRVTRALRSHIDAVLDAQDEIGRAHLRLEGIGKDRKEAVSGDDEMAARAKGVDDIMAKLSELATSLKSYHAVGTPALVFPPGGRSTSPNARSRAPMVTIATPEVARGSMAPATPVRKTGAWIPETATVKTQSPAEMTPVGGGKKPW